MHIYSNDNIYSINVYLYIIYNINILKNNWYKNIENSSIKAHLYYTNEE